MNNINAAIGLANYRFLKQVLFRQKDNASYYIENFDAPDEGTEWKLPTVLENSESAYYLFPLLVKRRAEFIAAMAKQGIECGPVHLRNDVAPCFDYLRNETPQLDAVHDNIVCLPVGWWVSDFDRERVVQVFNQGW